MDKIILDGTAKQQTEILKDFFGLKPEQKFEDLKVSEQIKKEND